jgi:hypothetical protein
MKQALARLQAYPCKRLRALLADARHQSASSQERDSRIAQLTMPTML